MAAGAPPRRVLAGAHVRLEPIDPARHGPQLDAALNGDPAAGVWEFLPDAPADGMPWPEYVAGLAASPDRIYFAAVEAATGTALGHMALMAIRPAHGVLEIGSIAFGPALQRTTASTEAVYLLARAAFDAGYRRVEWKCDARNLRSRRTAERLGFTFEGVFRQHMLVKGRNRDTAWYALLDVEWPDRRRALEAWLDPANFDAEGRQRRSLEQLRG